MKSLIKISILLLLTACSSKKEVDLIIHNGIIFTFNQSFEKHESMVVFQGKIIDLGNSREMLGKYKGNDININGRYVVPKLHLDIDSIRLVVEEFTPNYDEYLMHETPIRKGIEKVFEHEKELKVNSSADFNIITPGKRLFLPVEAYLNGKCYYNIQKSSKFPSTF